MSIKKQSTLTVQEELSLFRDIELNRTTGECICLKCVKRKIPFLAYKLASDKNIYYPEVWNEHKKAESQWLKAFTKRYKSIFSCYPTTCKRTLSQPSMSGLSSSFMENIFKPNSSQNEISKSIFKEVKIFKKTRENFLSIIEEKILKQIMEDKQSGCGCKSCLMDCLKKAYQEVCEKMKLYPQSILQTNEEFEKRLKNFEERHKNKILKFPLICKIISEETIKEQGSSKLVFDLKQERSLLIDLIETNSAKGDCICQKCVLEILPFSVYKLACNENLKNKTKQYPKSWNRSKKAGQQWMEKFIKRHEKEFAKLSFPCKINPSGPSGRAKATLKFLPVLENISTVD